MSVPDAALEILIAALNQNPQLAVDLTLTVGGSLVSGTAVGATVFWQTLADQDGQDRSGLREYFVDNAQASDRRAREPDAMFVHLLDSAHWLGAHDPVPASQWRGRLSDVQGWSVGRLGKRLPNSAG